jgi:hypothetical protein
MSKWSSRASKKGDEVSTADILLTGFPSNSFQRSTSSTSVLIRFGNVKKWVRVREGFPSLWD